MPSGSRLALVALLSVLAVGLMVPGAGVSAAGTAESATAHGTAGLGADASTAVVGSTDVAVDETGVPTPDRSGADVRPLLRDGTKQVAGDRYDSRTRIGIRLQSDGNARFQIRYAYNLTDDADRSAFQETAAAFENGDVTDLGLDSFRRANTVVSRTTDRAMEIRSPDRSSSITSETGGNATGTLTLSFTWTNFARVEAEGSRLVVDDVFVTPEGTWLPRLEDGQELVIRPPEGYAPVTGSGVLRDQTYFYWEGSQTFTNESAPSAVFTGDPGLPLTSLLALVFGGVVSVLGLGYLVVRRRDGRGPRDGGSAPAPAASPQNGDAEAQPPTDAANAPGGNGSEPDQDPDDESDSDDVDVELLSDEERVERLLDQNGGRMKQASIVKETGWSNAKVSQLLSAMAEDGQIDKLRIGRENLISFPEEDVTDVEE